MNQKNRVLKWSCLLLALALLSPLARHAWAGNSGVMGDCKFEYTPQPGHTQWLDCNGDNTPMYYDGPNGNYNKGEAPCGYWGNFDCGTELGEESNE